MNDFKCEAVTVGDLDLLRVFVEIRRGVDAEAARDALKADIKRVFEISSEVVLIERGTLAKEFEACIKAPRIVDKRG